MLTLDQVAEELQVNRAGVYAMVRRGELPALKLGGRGMWRVDRRDLETFIEQARDDTARSGSQNIPSSRASRRTRTRPPAECRCRRAR